MALLLIAARVSGLTNAPRLALYRRFVHHPAQPGDCPHARRAAYCRHWLAEQHLIVAKIGCEQAAQAKPAEPAVELRPIDLVFMAHAYQRQIQKLAQFDLAPFEIFVYDF